MLFSNQLIFKGILLLLLASFSGECYAQNPFTTIFLNLNNANSTDSIRISVNKPGRENKDKIVHSGDMRMDGVGLFSHTRLDGYCKEIIELVICNSNDSMIVRFRQEELGMSKNENCLFSIRFRLSIPFQAGYFEITNFECENGTYFFVADQWGNLPEAERELLFEY